MTDYLSELLGARICNAQQLEECHQALRKRVEEVWSDASAEPLDREQLEKELVDQGIWCSQEEMERLAKACNIQMPCEDAKTFDKNQPGRFIIPPDGCSEEEEAFSYVTMRF
ncbi:hypothetical protein GGR53DRAFT_526788 [Hypoxylon sp. FL1150]|nr:hypothetical protein GGR53DRAFT_526788 [Hypoxylon sp. FL1150]